MHILFLGSNNNNEGGETKHSSVGVAVGVSVAVTLLVAIPVGVLIGCCGLWGIGRRGTGGGSGRGQGQEMVVYEEPDPGKVAAAIVLTDNLAYEHVDLQRSRN